jgi:hypothetical protein
MNLNDQIMGVKSKIRKKESFLFFPIDPAGAFGTSVDRPEQLWFGHGLERPENIGWNSHNPLHSLRLHRSTYARFGE